MEIIRYTSFKNKDINAITLWPFIFINETLPREQLSTVIAHERIHIEQAQELLVIPFYIWYVIEYLMRYLKYRNWDKAYENISFEREAYANSGVMNSTYYKTRKHFSFLKYL